MKKVALRSPQRGTRYPLAHHRAGTLLLASNEAAVSHPAAR